MNITKKNIKGNSALCKKVRELYVSAFPKVERLPFGVLRLAALEKHSAIDAYFDGEDFLGFTFSTAIDNVYFIMFFAVDASLRGKGYGSAILSKIKADNPDKTVVLNIEPLVADAPNLKERENRLAFYQKNGFFDTGYYVREVGGVFTVMATEKTIDIASYQKVFKALTFEIWKVKIQKKEDWKGKI